jgi:hypothetical protein
LHRLAARAREEFAVKAPVAERFAPVNQVDPFEGRRRCAAKPGDERGRDVDEAGRAGFGAGCDAGTCDEKRDADLVIEERLAVIPDAVVGVAEPFAVVAREDDADGFGVARGANAGEKAADVVIAVGDFVIVEVGGRVAE